MQARRVSRPSSTVPVTNARPRAWTASASAPLTCSSRSGGHPAGRARKATIEVCGATASSSSGSASTRAASSRASSLERATCSAIPSRPRAAIVAQVFSALNGRVCSNPYSAKVPTGRVGVLAQVGRDQAERVAQVVAAAHQRAARVDRDAQPLVRVERERVGALHAAVARRERRVEHPEGAVGAVHVEPEPLRGRHAGERLERVDQPRVDGAGRADQQRRERPRGPVGGDRGAQRGRVELAAGERHGPHRGAAEAEQLERALDAAVRLVRDVREQARGARQAVAAHVVARLAERPAARTREAHDRGRRRAAREQAAAGLVREAHQLREPAHDRALEVDVGVVAGDDARVHRRRRQRGEHARRGRRRVDPPEEGRVAVAHRVGEDVAQGGRHQLLEGLAPLGQRQGQQPLAQLVRQRLPDGPRGQLGEVVGDPVHERVRGAAEGLRVGHGESRSRKARSAPPQRSGCSSQTK